MNPGTPPASLNGHPPANGLTADDVIYILFRHKQLILAFLCLGILGAVTVRLVRPPLYVSKAKLMVLYIPENRGAVNPQSHDTPNPKSLDVTPINSEVEILTSVDVAALAATYVGPEKVLARKGGGNDPKAATRVICSGIEVDPPKSAIITITFKHPDKEVVQPVLQAVIQAYERRHLDLRTGGNAYDDYLIRQRDELRKRLGETEEELKRLRKQTGVLSLEDAKKSYQKQVERLLDELLESKRDLAVRKALLGGSWGTPGQSESNTNGLGLFVPAEKLGDYSFVTSELENLKKKERELLMVYKEAYPLVQTVRNQIKKLSEQKMELERLYPRLTQMALGGSHSSTNVVNLDLAGELIEIRRLEARSKELGLSLSNLQAEADQMLDMEPQLRQLERQRDEEERNYRFVLSSLEQRHMDEASVPGKVINIDVVQSPTLPGIDLKKMLKLVAVVLVGCIGLGVGLAFLLELFLDRSLKRTVDVERHLHLPVFLTIPDTAWANRFALPWLTKPRTSHARKEVQVRPNELGQTGSELAPWSPGHELQTYAEGLRERILTYFEVRNLNLKKPKLVAVTGCGKGAGVSTLAGGLAAALSKTGDGNVLLVDMNVEQGMAQSFYKGNPSCALSDVLEPEQRAEAQVQENLYLATINGSQQEPLIKVLPSRFSHLMPKLKASDYDYIIFDMPPVSQTSTTPRLAGYMDLVLLVLESEKTGQQTASRATGLMRESRANVAAVLNKYRSHVPAPLSQEL